MQSILALTILLLSSTALANRICVRNFGTGPVDMCGFGSSPRHVYVISERDERVHICTMTYDDERCKFDKQEFAHAITPDKKIVCVLNYNQPDVTGNYCVAQPETYGYVKDPWL